MDNRGVYQKFIVTRTDGRDAPGEKHHSCVYFVLDIKHDPFALDALEAYARACRAEMPELAADLLEAVKAGRRKFVKPEMPEEVLSRKMRANESEGGR